MDQEKETKQCRRLLLLLLTFVYVPIQDFSGVCGVPSKRHLLASPSRQVQPHAQGLVTNNVCNVPNVTNVFRNVGTIGIVTEEQVLIG